MIKTRIAVLSTCLMVIAGGAFAQDNAKKAEELRRSSEMMKPPTDAPSGAMNKGGSSTPMSEADKKAEEMRKSSEMMKPQGNNPPAGAMSHGTSKPMTAEEMKAEEARRKSEQMKPQ
jgi:hypothetical protein